MLPTHAWVWNVNVNAQNYSAFVATTCLKQSKSEQIPGLRSHTCVLYRVHLGSAACFPMFSCPIAFWSASFYRRLISILKSGRWTMKPLKPGPLLPEKGGVLFSSSFFRDSALTCAINSKVFFAIPGKLICVSSKIVFLFLREQMDARRREVFFV